MLQSFHNNRPMASTRLLSNRSSGGDDDHNNYDNIIIMRTKDQESSHNYSSASDNKKKKNVTVTSTVVASDKRKNSIVVMPSSWPSQQEDGDMVHILLEKERSIDFSQQRPSSTTLSQTTSPPASKKLVLPIERESYFGAFGRFTTTNNDRRHSDDDDECEEDIMGDEELVTVSHPTTTTTTGGGGGGGASTGDPVVSIVPPLSLESQDAPGGFDVCKEYGYKYEYTEDYESDDDDSHSSHQSNPAMISNQKKKHTTSTTTNNITTMNNNNNPNYKTNILGKSYHPILDYTLRRTDESGLLWFTYRCDFPEIKPYNITSDAGWGCMLRSAQMLLAQALRRHYCGRNYIPPPSMAQRRIDMFYQDVCMWFADFPSFDTGCWYSLQNMVAAGIAKYETLPGEWFGPGTACYILRDLVELHQRAWDRKYGVVVETKKKKNKENKEEREIADNDGKKETNERERQPKTTTTTTTTPHLNNSCSSGGGGEYKRDHPVMRVYVAPEGCVYRDDVRNLMTRDSQKFKREEEEEKEKEEEVKKSFTKSKESSKKNTTTTTTTTKSKKTKMIDDPFLHPLSINNEMDKEQQQESDSKLEWDTSLLILIPLRLGLEKFNASTYSKSLAHSFSLSQSVGFLGGSPRHALWFYGAQSDGSKVFGLDPHTVQSAPSRRRLRPEEEERTGYTKQYQVQLSDAYLRSIQCLNPVPMDMNKIDPSMALGFFCRDRNDFDLFCDTIKTMTDLPALFAVADSQPDYTADVSSAMVEMMMGSSSSQIGEMITCDGGGVDDDADDDFVML